MECLYEPIAQILDNVMSSMDNAELSGILNILFNQLFVYVILFFISCNFYLIGARYY